MTHRDLTSVHGLHIEGYDTEIRNNLEIVYQFHLLKAKPMMLPLGKVVLGFNKGVITVRHNDCYMRDDGRTFVDKCSIEDLSLLRSQSDLMKLMKGVVIINENSNLTRNADAVCDEIVRECL